MATLKELRAQASALGIPGRSSMNKAELEAMIAQAEGTNVPPPVEYGTAVPLTVTSPRGRGRSPQERQRSKATARRRRARINKRGY